jgi:RNA polymerase sigma-70 factor (ECF subfamily)
MLRRRKGNLLSMDELPPMVDLSMPHSEQPEQVVIEGQVADQVQSLLNALTPAYRTPVILRYWYDMSYKEIADTMGVTESTIKTRLHRARAKLAESAQDNHEITLEDHTYEHASV